MGGKEREIKAQRRQKSTTHEHKEREREVKTKPSEEPQERMTQSQLKSTTHAPAACPPATPPPQSITVVSYIPNPTRMGTYYLASIVLPVSNRVYTNPIVCD